MSEPKRLASYAINPVKVSGELQMTEYGKQLLEKYAGQNMPDAIYAEYTGDDGVKYAGTLYRVIPKEQEG